MSFYPENINELFLAPLNVGETLNASAAGTVGSFTCGSVLRLTLKIDDSSHLIKEAKFKASGCGFLIAAASLFTEAIKGMKREDVARFCSHPELLEDFFNEHFQHIPQERGHCFSLCRDALEAALNDYHNAVLEEWHGEEALICTCFGVSEKMIENVIKEKSLQSVFEVTEACSAGGGCGSCQPLIEDILDDYRRSFEYRLMVFEK